MNPKITIPTVIAILVIVTAIVMLSFGTHSQPQIVQNPTTDILQGNKTPGKFFEGTNNVKEIPSHEDLKNIIEISSLLSGDLHKTRAIQASAEIDATPMPDDTFFSPERAPVPLEESQSRVPDHSSTNIQVKNVDEPDYLKNDSKYVYIVSENTLSIIDAYPAASAEMVLKIKLDIESQYIRNMFLNDDRLVIFYNGQSDDEIIPQYDFVPRRSHSPVTHALIVDVSDKEHPTIFKDYSIDGRFMDARMIENHAYFVTNSHLDHQHPKLPIITEDSVRIMTPPAFYFDNLEKFSNFNTVTAIDIFGDKINSKSFLMGHSGTFYVSDDNFYLTYQQNTPEGFYENLSRDRFFGVIVPLLPNNIQEQIGEILEDPSMNLTQWTNISELMQESYNQMDQYDREELFEKIKKALNEYDVRVQKDVIETVIHKIAINGDSIEHVAKGSVSGKLLNQFSMDESGDRFRVATTIEQHIQHHGIVLANAVYVLDEQLNIVGELEGIAENEEIFSARFIGDRLYLVTFRLIDPFFVIDLSSDEPKILGELKIPGFLNYLHPYDEDHIIGFGRHTKEIGNGGFRQLGIKMTLFNVTDVNNPTVADNIIIGGRETWSIATHDHKAFFFDKKRGIVSFPISSDAERIMKDVTKDLSITYNYWHGFYVFDLDSQGFSLRGTVAHKVDVGLSHFGMDNARIFYIGDVLYTVSERYLKMNSLDDLREITSIKLDNTEESIGYMDR